MILVGSDDILGRLWCMLKKEKRVIKQGLPPPDECYGINNIINQEDEAIHTTDTSSFGEPSYGLM